MSYNFEVEEYHYDIGYYEGVRNILQIINQTLGVPTKTEVERIEMLLKLVGEELDDAKKSHKESERILYN
jgi:predicted ATPase